MPYKNVGVIIQARLGSTRFPKKHIKKLGSIKVIDWVIDRIKLSKKIKKIILATTNLKEDKILIKIAKNSTKLTKKRIFSANMNLHFRPG